MFNSIFTIISLIALTVASPTWDRRIIGGNDAASGQFPYQASVRHNANQHFCGGSIINDRWILSAAHCIFGPQTGLFIVVGSHLSASGGSTHQSQSYVNHPEYDRITLANDVSVIQSATPMTFNDLVQPIALASSFTAGGINAVVSGWGNTIPGVSSIPNNLQYLLTTTLTNADCRARLGGSEWVFDHKICTLTIAGQGNCNADSGGPLVAAGSQIGIVSWGISPCGGGSPDGYDRVAYFRTWILEQIA